MEADSRCLRYYLSFGADDNFMPTTNLFCRDRRPRLSVFMDYGWLDLFATLVANKRIFLMSYDITLLRKDEKFALGKPLVCAGSSLPKSA